MNNLIFIKFFLIVILSINSSILFSQGIKFHGIYESIPEKNSSFNSGFGSTYFRFYADGVALTVSTESNSKEVIKKWFVYSNQNVANGFFFIENNVIFISTVEPIFRVSRLAKGIINNKGEIELIDHYYDEGMVHRSKKSLYTFKPFK